MSQHIWTRTGPFKGFYTVETEHERIRVVRGDTARLIAAAPELLQALVSVLASVPFMSYRGDGELEECEQLVRNAIAKATQE